MSFQICFAADEFGQLTSAEVEASYVIVVVVPNEALFAQSAPAEILATGRLALMSV